MMIQNKAYKTATLSLVLFMSAQAIKADNETVSTTEKKIVEVNKSTDVASNNDTTKEAKSGREKKEKKVVKAKEPRLRDNQAVSAFIPTPWKRFKQWARIESKGNKANAADDAYTAIENYYRPSETDNEVQRATKAMIYPHIVAIKEAKDQQDFARVEKELAILDRIGSMARDLQDTVGCLIPITKTEKDLQEALIRAERPIVAPILKFKELWNESGKKIEDILNKHASSEQSNFQELTAELAVMQKALTGLYEQDLANPINEKRIAKSKIQILKDYLGYVTEKIAPENDLAMVGAPENNENLAATLPASDAKVSKEVKTEETKNAEASETK